MLGHFQDKLAFSHEVRGFGFFGVEDKSVAILRIFYISFRFRPCIVTICDAMREITILSPSCVVVLKNA